MYHFKFVHVVTQYDYIHRQIHFKERAMLRFTYQKIDSCLQTSDELILDKILCKNFFFHLLFLAHIFQQNSCVLLLFSCVSTFGLKILHKNLEALVDWDALRFSLTTDTLWTGCRNRKMHIFQRWAGKINSNLKFCVKSCEYVTVQVDADAKLCHYYRREDVWQFSFKLLITNGKDNWRNQVSWHKMMNWGKIHQMLYEIIE